MLSSPTLFPYFLLFCYPYIWYIVLVVVCDGELIIYCSFMLVSYTSLYLHVDSTWSRYEWFIDHYRETPCADSKCIPRCWYCNDLCDNCLLPAIVGLKVVTKEDILLKFCSDQCQRAYCGLKELVVNAELPRLGDQREILMHVCAAGTNQLVSHFTVQMQIYQSSSGSYEIPADHCYVTYQFRSPFSQELLEFFISSNLSPIDPLPHLTSEQAVQSLQLIRESGLVQSILQKAFEVVGIKDLCALVHLSQR